MRSVMSAAVVFLGLTVCMPLAAVHAEDPPVPPVTLAGSQSYGPAVDPSVGVETPTVEPGRTVNVFGSNFCSNVTVGISISPAVAGAPSTVTADAQGNVAFSFPAPSGTGPYTITLTGQSQDASCARSGNTAVTVMPAAPSAGPVVVGNLPATGSATAVVQLRSAVAAMLAGLALVVVSSRRRRATQRVGDV